MLRVLSLVILILMAPTSADAARYAEATGRTTGAFHALNVNDAQAMADWYGQMLNFEIAWSFESDDPASVMRRQMLLHGRGAVLELIELRSPQGEVFADRPRNPTVMGVIKLGFVVDDLDAAETQLRARGASFQFDPFQSSVPGLRSFAIRDPEGNTIQIFGP